MSSYMIANDVIKNICERANLASSSVGLYIVKQGFTKRYVSRSVDVISISTMMSSTYV